MSLENKLRGDDHYDDSPRHREHMKAVKAILIEAMSKGKNVILNITACDAMPKLDPVNAPDLSAYIEENPFEDIDVFYDPKDIDPDGKYRGKGMINFKATEEYLAKQEEEQQ